MNVVALFVVGWAGTGIAAVVAGRWPVRSSADLAVAVGLGPAAWLGASTTGPAMVTRRPTDPPRPLP